MSESVTSSTINAQSPLAVLDIGLVTPLATGWQESCAAMYAGYDAFVYPEDSLFPVAEVPFNPEIRGYLRLAHLLRLARADLSHDYDAMPVLCALPEAGRAGLISSTETCQRLFDAIATLPEFHGKFRRDYLECFDQGRTSLVHQLQRAQEILNTTDHEKVMIMAVDSWLFPQTLNTLLADHWDRDPVSDKRRLLTAGEGEDHTDGFIPAEAAGIIVVGKPAQHDSPYLIDGTACEYEPVPLLSGAVCKAQGLTAAIHHACVAAGCTLNHYPLRIAGISGEQYFFREASLAQTRNLTSRVEHQPLWLPASHTGETGAVSGLIILAMAMDNFEQGHLPGERVLCHLSNDEHDRTAFSLKYHLPKAEAAHPGQFAPTQIRRT